MIRRSLLSLVGALLLAVPLAAQTTYAPTTPLALGDSLFALPTAHIPAEGIWEIKVTHRFQQSSDQGNPSTRIPSLFGLDRPVLLKLELLQHVGSFKPRGAFNRILGAA